MDFKESASKTAEFVYSQTMRDELLRISEYFTQNSDEVLQMRNEMLSSIKLMIPQKGDTVKMKHDVTVKGIDLTADQVGTVIWVGRDRYPKKENLTTLALFPELAEAARVGVMFNQGATPIFVSTFDIQKFEQE